LGCKENWHKPKMEQSIKKYLPRPRVAFLGLLVLACIGACLFFSIPDSPVRFASRALGVKVPDDSIVIIDQYDGPNIPTGDGYSWTVLQIPSEKIDEFTSTLAESSDWKSLPLSAELAQNDWCLQPGLTEGEIPIVNTTGYYFLNDYQEAYNQENNRQRYETEKPLCERTSQNFLFGLFDEKDGKLYIWSINT
jgi:hypothetical protein